MVTETLHRAYDDSLLFDKGCDRISCRQTAPAAAPAKPRIVAAVSERDAFALNRL